jgi:erythrocyte membrane protein band 4.1
MADTEGIDRALTDAVTASQERLRTDDRNQGTLKSVGGKSGDEEAPLVSNNGTVDKSTAKSSRSGNTVPCEVALPDGSVINIDISSQATGQQIFDAVCEKLNLLEREYFSCTYQRGDVKFWLKMDKPVKKQIKGGPWKFSFEVKFYPVDPTALHEELTRYQVYLQVREDICTGKLPCSFVTLALLGSYAAMSQLGDYDCDEHGSGIEYIKKVRFAPSQTAELLERIAELHRTHRGQTPGEAEFHYLENAKNMALYGVHLHPAVNSEGETVNVGVCAAGLVIYKDKIRLHRFVWAKIIKISYKRNIFTIQIRANKGEPKQNNANDLFYKYKLANLTMAKRLWRLAVEHHAFFRLREPEQETKKRFSRIGSKYHFTGRTQYQSQQAAELITRSTQNVNRGVTGERFIWDRTLDPGTPGTSIDRTEEVVMEGYRTATLDLKRRNKGSVPFADVDDEANAAATDQQYDGSRVYLGETVMYQKTTNPSTSSFGEVFLTLPGQVGGTQGQRRTSQDDYLQTGARTPDTAYDTGTYENVHYAGRTPYPGPDILQRYPTDEHDGQQGGYGYQDDHLKVQGGQLNGSNEGNWSTTVTKSKTTTRTYTAPDGTLVTEHRTEKDGVVETRIEKRTMSVDIDYDQALADAIFAVTDMNPDMSVEKIEIHTKSED